MCGRRAAWAALMMAIAACVAASRYSDPKLSGCGWHACTHCKNGPCGPGNDECGGTSPKYTFHLNDFTCDINDPNGPFYDPVHGMYHNFYQDHLAEPQGGAGDGPDWGHWISRDFVKWVRLPVAIWNDQWYDNAAIFTGSTTIVDGKPVIVYPGKCKGPLCPTGFTYDVAIPKNGSDPLYTEWIKPDYNPIVNGTGDDPSTAWQTAEGEWRLIGNQGCKGEGGVNGAPIYGSMDFKTWYKIGCTTLTLGDCPTFFPLPALTPGSENLAAGQDLPTHVHKAGSGNDQVQVGTWTEGKKGPTGTGTPGTWAIFPGTKSVPVDNGKTHASKDFYDPVKKRRILWVWGTVPSGIQTIPRVLTYHPGIKQIVYSPVEEMLQLRSGQIAGVSGQPLAPNVSVPLAVAGAADVSVFFEVPKEPMVLAVTLQADSTGAGTFQVYIDFKPAAAGDDVYSAGVGAGKPPSEAREGVESGALTDTLMLMTSDTELELRIFLDGTVAEAYWQGGRVAMTIPTTNSSYVGISSSAAGNLVNATSYGMTSIWTTKEELLASARL